MRSHTVQPDATFAQHAVAGAATVECRGCLYSPTTNDRSFTPNCSEQGADEVAQEEMLAPSPSKRNAGPISFPAADGVLSGGESRTNTLRGATNSQSSWHRSVQGMKLAGSMQAPSSAYKIPHLQLHWRHFTSAGKPKKHLPRRDDNSSVGHGLVLH